MNHIQLSRHGVNDCRMTLQCGDRYVTIEANLRRDPWGKGDEPVPTAGRVVPCRIEYIVDGRCIRSEDDFTTSRRGFFRRAGHMRRFLRNSPP